MKKNFLRQRGLSLVEIMVGLVIGLITVMVIGQVAAEFEGQKRTSTGGGDAQSNGAAALFLLERDIRMAGYGLMIGSWGQMCPLGINIYFNGTVMSDPGANPANGGILAPVRIIDGGGDNADTIVMARADAPTGIMPNTIIRDMPNSASEIRVTWGAGLQQGQLILVGARNGSKICTLMQLSQDPQPVQAGAEFNLQHNPGQFPYNPPNPNVFTNAPAYTIGDIVLNLSNLNHQRYSVQCNQLTVVDPIVTAAPYTCANTQPLVDQIVNVQARYGVAPAGSLTVNNWVEPTGVWAANTLTAAQIGRILAVRVAVLARSPQMEKEAVEASCNGGSGSIALWAGGPAIALSGDECKYRYKVFETVVPIRNSIWGCGQTGVSCSP